MDFIFIFCFYFYFFPLEDFKREEMGGWCVDRMLLIGTCAVLKSPGNTAQALDESLLISDIQSRPSCTEEACLSHKRPCFEI